MSSEAIPYSRKNPFPATVEVNRRLTGEGSEKDTRHYELSLAGSGLCYECGDSLGVFASNCPDLVEEIIKALRATGDEQVPGNDGAAKTLRDALTTDYQITQPSKKFIQHIAENSDKGSLLQELLDPLRKNDLESYLWGMEFIDFLQNRPSIRFTPEEFVKLLRKLQPRLYSIASSFKANPESVHLTIATVTYESNGRKRKGVASNFFANSEAKKTSMPVFIHVAKGFRLPEDGGTPIIMVGPGTGVAPFRAFLQERKTVGATGRNWLFFGEQHRSSDYLYGEEFETLKKEGLLSRLDLAFSRDQENKIYVQDRMLENAAELWKWLEDGAHFYVCGDAKRMAKDVDVALRKIAVSEGGKTEEEAAEYVETLKKEKRYKRDVY